MTRLGSPRHPPSPLVISSDQGRELEAVHQVVDRLPEDWVTEVVPMQMMTRRGLEWLSAAADEPERCRAVWADDPRRPYTLPVGRFFDVVAVDQRHGVETCDQLERHGMPVGPVMADWAARQVGFFLPPGSRNCFGQMVAEESTDPPAYRYLGCGSVVVVPGPMPLTGDRYVWLRAPVWRPLGGPTQVAALAAMFVAASGLVARAERYGEEHGRASSRGREVSGPEAGASRA